MLNDEQVRPTRTRVGVEKQQLAQRKWSIFDYGVLVFLCFLVIGTVSKYNRSLVPTASLVLLWLIPVIRMLFLVIKYFSQRNNIINTPLEIGNVANEPQSNHAGLLLIPHETFKQKLIFILYAMGIVLFSLLHPIAFIISFIVLLFFTGDIENVFVYFSLSLISVPVYYYFLKRDFNYRIKSTNLLLEFYLNTVFLSQLVYVFLYSFSYYVFFVLPDKLYDVAGMLAWLFQILAIGLVILAIPVVIVFSNLIFLTLMKRKKTVSGTV